MKRVDYWGIVLILAGSIYAAIRTGSKIVAILVAMASAVLPLLIYISEKLSRRSKNVHPLVESLRRARQGKSEVVKLFADAKFAEAKSFIDDLATGKCSLTDPRDVHTALRSGYCDDLFVTKILATSCGELPEWTSPVSWLEKGYPAMNRVAIHQGKSVSRIFILRPDEEWRYAEPAVKANLEIGVKVKIASQSSLSAQDLYIASNCLIFCDNRRPLFAVGAIHDKDGWLTSVGLYATKETMQPIIDAYKRIESVAEEVGDTLPKVVRNSIS